jgi:DNA mismatch repair ATPase MutS
MASSEFYRQRVQHFSQQGRQIEKIIKRYSIIRILIFLAAGIVIYIGISQPYFFWLLPLLILVFSFLVSKQTHHEEERQLTNYLEQLNANEADAFEFKSIDFSDGSRFVDAHHPYSHDLDIFGDGSIYQYLNRCGTQLGEERLASDLKTLPYTEKDLVLRQQAVRELGAMIEFRQQIWGVGRQINDFTFDRSSLFSWLAMEPLVYNKSLFTLLRWVLPAITLIILGLIYFDGAYFPLLFIMMMVQLSITGYYSKQIGEFQRKLSTGKKVMGNYARIFEKLAHQKVESELMKSHQQMATRAFNKVKQFAEQVNAFEARMNPIAMMFGNGLFLYDFQILNKLEKWREENANELPHWLESLGEWDSLLSLATLHYNYPNYTFAKINNALVLESRDMGHPLIPDKSRVTNNFDLGKPAKVWLITGANMAGKSTFLRSLGANFVLGSIGSPVCASYWVQPLVAMRSGMRTTDSLQEHQSYFYAELHRLQSIMEELRSGKSMIILLDEILKGTNSTDKQAGSRELLQQLKDQHALVVLATHDIALGDLESQYPDQITNACFEGNIENDQLTFDYTLHKGVALKANATFLMKKMGIIPIKD